MSLLFVLLLVLGVAGLVLAFPLGVMSVQFVTVLAVLVLGFIAWILYDRLKQTLSWINGKPVDGGQVGQVTRGVQWWITKSSFARGGDTTLSDPDPNKPIEPPPPGF